MQPDTLERKDLMVRRNDLKHLAAPTTANNLELAVPHPLDDDRLIVLAQALERGKSLLSASRLRPLVLGLRRRPRAVCALGLGQRHMGVSTIVPCMFGCAMWVPSVVPDRLALRCGSVSQLHLLCSAAHSRRGNAWPTLEHSLGKAAVTDRDSVLCLFFPGGWSRRLGGGHLTRNPLVADRFQCRLSVMAISVGFESHFGCVIRPALQLVNRGWLDVSNYSLPLAARTTVRIWVISRRGLCQGSNAREAAVHLRRG
mmetsp:Transcript_3108/g.7335  ORF Transcript_3108/g.7335 Transcript_3108/m.7335 type:complete len:256 (+) Transcript_3108:169-936(+)